MPKFHRFLLMGMVSLAALLTACSEPSFVEEQTTIPGEGDALPAGAQGEDGGGVDGFAPPDSTEGDPEPGEDGGDGSDGGVDGGVDGGIDGGDGADGGMDGVDGAGDGGIDGGTDGSADGGGGDGDDGGVADAGADGELEPREITKSMSFDTALLGDASVTKDLDDPYLYQEITLARQYDARSQQTEQIERRNYAEAFNQGHDGEEATENFNQQAGRPLDILIVIDNSGSMKEEQVNLAARLAPLLSYVEDTDWAIGVVTTDPNKSCLRALIKKGDANIQTKFENAIQAGTNGTGNERGILTAINSLSGSCLNAPWIRASSTLAVLIVSDEDNCSDGQGCQGKNYREASYLTGYLNSIRVAGVNAKVYGLFWHPSQDQTACSTADYQANIYSQAVDATGGTWGSICDADYSQTLSVISQNIAVVLNRSFTLQKTPETGTLRVFVDGVEKIGGYTLMGKVVTFDQAPADGSVVTVSYRHGAVPLVNSFKLQYEPIPERTTVTVDGMAVDPSMYTVNPGNKTVTLTETPPQKARIDIAYTRNEPLNDQYVIFDEVADGSMRVYFDNVETTDFTVSYGTNIFGVDYALVKFPVPPPEGALLDFNYLEIGDPVLRYPFQTAMAPVDLAGYDAQTGAPVRVTYVGSAVDVNGADWVEGRNVLLRYDNVDRQTFDVELPQMPLVDSVMATGGNKTCTTQDMLVVNGQTVRVTGCDFADDVSMVKVDYEYVIERYMTFTFNDPDLPAENDWQRWRVFIDDVETTDYERQGNVIIFAEPPPVRSKVTIEMTRLEELP